MKKWLTIGYLKLCIRLAYPVAGTYTKCIVQVEMRLAIVRASFKESDHKLMFDLHKTDVR